MANNIEFHETSTSNIDNEKKAVIEDTKSQTLTLRERIKKARGNIANWKIPEAIATLISPSGLQQHSETTNQNQPSELKQPNESAKQQQSSESTNQQQSSQAQESKEKEPKNSKIVSIKEYIPNIKYDIKYATTDNFAKRKMYESQEQYLKLQYQAVKRLKKAEEIAESEWFSLKIWDAYRSTAAQEALRKWYDEAGLPQNQKWKYVAKPTTLWWKWSNHWRWNAIDLTLADKNWNELEMPTKFDEFWSKAHWSHVNKLADNDTKKKNALKLKEIMWKAWFTTYENEWWHFELKQ